MFDPKTGYPITLSSAVPADELITLKQAAASLPRRRAGRPTSVATLYRWTTRGCRGVRLRYTQVGCTRCTTGEWLLDFFGQLTEIDRGPGPGTPPAPPPQALRSPGQRQRGNDNAARLLTKEGI